MASLILSLQGFNWGHGATLLGRVMLERLPAWV